MTKQEKQLLLIDLCARLPYGVKVKFKNIIQPQRLHWSYVSDEKDWDLPKPFLRPVSSMTDEEDKQYCSLKGEDVTKTLALEVDWLNSNYFDYRGLIDKGLALEAPEGMYK